MYAQFMRPRLQPRASAAIRLIHRWTSAAFVLCVIATTIALAQPKPALWMSYVPLAPLAVLSLTGMYMFLRPYFARKPAARDAL